MQYLLHHRSHHLHFHCHFDNPSLMMVAVWWLEVLYIPPRNCLTLPYPFRILHALPRICNFPQCLNIRIITGLKRKLYGLHSCSKFPGLNSSRPVLARRMRPRKVFAALALRNTILAPDSIIPG